MYALGVGRQLDEEYVASGQVRVVWQHMAILGPESVLAAEAAECAGEQDRFWEYRDRVLAESQGRASRNEGALGKPRLKALAGELRLDGTAFNSCLDSGRYRERVQAETEAGRRQGVDRTPTLEINGQRIVGVPTMEDLRMAISAAQTRAAAAIPPRS
jgi:protein-disulfide isomerase